MLHSISSIEKQAARLTSINRVILTKFDAVRNIGGLLLFSRSIFCSKRDFALS